jgi:hypothetical protein
MTVFQLRVVIAGISPLIWRRLEVAAGTTGAGLHAIVQTVFGWSGEHLHRFVIGGTEYGISYASPRPSVCPASRSVIPNTTHSRPPSRPLSSRPAVHRAGQPDSAQDFTQSNGFCPTFRDRNGRELCGGLPVTDEFGDVRRVAVRA